MDASTPPRAETEAARAGAALAAEPATQAQPARILLVEDSEHDRRFFTRLLERHNDEFHVTVRPAADAALATLQEEHFDLLVADLHMPGMTGLELVAAAQPYLTDTGVLILTGSRDVTDAAQAVRLGVLDYIFKEPREPLRENLLGQLRAAARQVRLRAENRRLQAELQRRVEFLERIYEQMPDALFATLSREGRILDINPQAFAMLGVDEREELVGWGIEDALGRLGEELARATAEIVQRGAPVSALYVEAHNDDGDRLFLLSLNRFREAQARDRRHNEGPTTDIRPPHWILTLRDVTPERSRRREDIASFHGLVGRDPGLLQVVELIRRVAPLPIAALVTGPTGSGKEVVAHAIHQESDRAGKPFIAVNCTALSSEILESELFGHVRGAFTGAINPRKGRFREADGGTLFLDEIGDTTESFQTKLLRALDSGQIEPVGQDRPVQVDVRIICATNRDLEKAVKEGRFREDLFYRINVVHIQLPSLAQRPGDIPLLVEAFRREFNQRFNRSIRFISQDAMRALAEYGWPGNVRELRHTLERAFVVADGPVITIDDLPPAITGRPMGRTWAVRPTESVAASEEIGEPSGEAPSSGASPAASGLSTRSTPSTQHVTAPAAFSPRLTEREIQEAEQIRASLAENDGNIGLTAKILNMHRTTLWRKMRQYGIDA